MLFLRYWQPILSAIAAFAISYVLHSAVMMITKAKHEAEIASVQKALKDEFAKEIKKTEDNSRAYQSKVYNLNKLLDNLKRVHAGRCVYVQTPSGSSDSTSSGNLNVRGIDANTLIEYGGKCEQLRLQLISLQDYLR